MGLLLYLERVTNGVWERESDLLSPCDHTKTKVKQQPGCPLCGGTDFVPRPDLVQPGKTRGDQLSEVIKHWAGQFGVLGSTDPALKPLYMKASSSAPMACQFPLLRDLPWSRAEVPVQTFVHPHEWLAWKAMGRPPGEPRFSIPFGYRKVSDSEMHAVVHEVGGFDPNLTYVTKVQWNRPASEHFKEFIEALRSLNPRSNPDTLRAVFWLTR